MFNPPTHYGRRLNITYPRGRLLHFLFWVCEFSGFQIAKTSVNKRLLCNRFLALPISAFFNLAVQNYYIFLTYASLYTIFSLFCLQFTLFV